MGAKGGGVGSTRAAIPPGFRGLSKDFARGLSSGLVNAPSFAPGLRTATDFFFDFANKPTIQAGREALLGFVEDPSRLGLPLFQESQERLRGALTEGGRRFGIRSSATEDLVSRGLASHENQFLSESAARQMQAAQALAAFESGVGQAGFTPFQAAAGFFGPLLSSATGRFQPPRQFGNPFGALLGLGGSLLGAAGSAGGFAKLFGTAAPAAAAACDENLKENLVDIAPDDILARLKQLRIREWNYKDDPARHIGPTAQDFHALFPELGYMDSAEREIAYIDMIGALMASVQGLTKRVERLEGSDG